MQNAALSGNFVLPRGPKIMNFRPAGQILTPMVNVTAAGYGPRQVMITDAVVRGETKQSSPSVAPPVVQDLVSEVTTSLIFSSRM